MSSLMKLSAIAAMTNTIRFAPEGRSDLTTMSLAELADMDADDIVSVKSLLFPEGVYAVSGKTAIMTATSPDANELDKDGNPKKPLVSVNFSFTVLEAKPKDLTLDPEALLNRVITERYTIWPAQMKDLIGMLKNRYETIGIDPTGMKLGGVEGGEPGMIDSIVDFTFMIRIRHSKPNAEGIQRAYYDWKALPTQGDDE